LALEWGTQKGAWEDFAQKGKEKSCREGLLGEGSLEEGGKFLCPGGAHGFG